jgi:transcriptional regulator with XRE-family HTH domain
MLTLGEAIRRLRMAGGLSQRQLAAKLETDPTYLSHIEAGRREPSISLLRNFAKQLDIPPGLLLSVALWADLPPTHREQFRPILEKLLELGSESQLRLGLELK